MNTPCYKISRTIVTSLAVTSFVVVASFFAANSYEANAVNMSSSQQCNSLHKAHALTQDGKTQVKEEESV